MPTITLISDWKQSDFYIAAVKGKILSLYPQAVIVDISHQVDAFSIMQAAFIAKHSYRLFPQGSIHIIAVNHESDQLHPHILAKYDGHYFICADDGLLSLVFDSEPEMVVRIEKDIFSVEQHSFKFTSFPALSVYTFAAAFIALGGSIEDMGAKLDGIYKLMALMPQIEGSAITGNVIYIDTYQNAITNISQDLFWQVGNGRKFEILLHSFYYKINKINNNYSETSDGELLAIFNSLGLLEIALKNGRAAEMLNLDINSSIRVKFL
ncbi:MAG: SAM-dependent chlorinase/fluorinase [Bacteroidia bacterium]|nr:SAM-dependent chlorinase/fluorinase [Bacteroidia bacterium]